jgi:hypothetical protein
MYTHTQEYRTPLLYRAEPCLRVNGNTYTETDYTDGISY